MFFELRQYRIRPGQRAAWVALMEAEIIPFQTAQGMDIRGSWVGEEDETQYSGQRGPQRGPAWPLSRWTAAGEGRWRTSAHGLDWW